MKAISSNAFAGTHTLRCVHCGLLQPEVGRLFRCTQCGELLEVIYPDWEVTPASAERFKRLWLERKLSTAARDLSGVWRYRELLPQINLNHIVTLGEGNTPLLPLGKSAQTLGLHDLRAKQPEVSRLFQLHVYVHSVPPDADVQDSLLEDNVSFWGHSLPGAPDKVAAWH